MTIDEALDGVEVSEREALKEMKRHNFAATIEHRADCFGRSRRAIVVAGQTVAFADRQALEYNSADIMAWLGY